VANETVKIAPNAVSKAVSALECQQKTTYWWPRLARPVSHHIECCIARSVLHCALSISAVDAGPAPPAHDFSLPPVLPLFAGLGGHNPGDGHPACADERSRRDCRAEGRVSFQRASLRSVVLARVCTSQCGWPEANAWPTARARHACIRMRPPHPPHGCELLPICERHSADAPPVTHARTRDARLPCDVLVIHS
jgi:hypothetical protein